MEETGFFFTLCEELLTQTAAISKGSGPVLC